MIQKGVRFQKVLVILGAAAWIGMASQGCTPVPAPEEAAVFTLDARPGPERYCAWFADRQGDRLYFGIAAFWSALRAAGGDPMADTRTPGAQWIGRFDLVRPAMLPPLAVGDETHAGGVWDLQVLASGRIFFTTYFDPAGIHDPHTGRTRRLPELGLGLNEITEGPDDTLLVTRYASGPEIGGAVLQIDALGHLLARHELVEPPGYRVAAKSIAFDPVRRQVWVNTDLLPRADGPVAHDQRVLDLDGHEIARWSEPELQFVAFGPDGTGLFAEREGQSLWLRWLPPDPRLGPSEGHRLLLDPAFPEALDFAQEVRLEPDGTAVVTRWSGTVHLVDRRGHQRRVRLPQRKGDLYYTASLEGGRLCATRCGDIQVVCRDLAR